MYMGVYMCVHCAYCTYSLPFFFPMCQHQPMYVCGQICRGRRGKYDDTWVLVARWCYATEICPDSLGPTHPPDISVDSKSEIHPPCLFSGPAPFTTELIHKGSLPTEFVPETDQAESALVGIGDTAT